MPHVGFAIDFDASLVFESQTGASRAEYNSEVVVVVVTSESVILINLAAEDRTDVWQESCKKIGKCSPMKVCGGRSFSLAPIFQHVAHSENLIDLVAHASALH